MNTVKEWLNKVIATSDDGFGTDDFFMSHTPTGWQDLTRDMLRFKELCGDGCTITSMEVEKGLLRFKGTCRQEIDQKLFNRITNSVAMSSSMLCMVCGARGFRRKREDGWPCLCAADYIVYVNNQDF